MNYRNGYIRQFIASSEARLVIVKADELILHEEINLKKVSLLLLCDVADPQRYLAEGAGLVVLMLSGIGSDLALMGMEYACSISVKISHHYFVYACPLGEQLPHNVVAVVGGFRFFHEQLQFFRGIVPIANYRSAQIHLLLLLVWFLSLFIPGNCH